MQTVIQQSKSHIHTRLLILLGALFISWLSMIPFIESRILRLLLLLPCSFVLFRILHVWQQQRKLLFIREQYKWLLEYLLARLTARASLEHALMNASESLSLLLGRNSALASSLKHIKHQIEAGNNLNDILVRLSHTLPCPETKVFFPALAVLRDVGGQVDLFIRHQQRQLVELLDIQRDVESENTQRRTEAALLCLMPFALALLLRNTVILQESQSLLFTQIANLAAYLLSITALYLALTGLVTGENKYMWKPFMSTFSKFDTNSSKIGNLLKKLYHLRMPSTVSARLFHRLQAEAVDEKLSAEDLTNFYFNRKARLILFSCLPAIVMTIAFPSMPVWIFLPLAIALIQDQQVFIRADKQEIAYRLEIPWLLNTVNSLLQAGLSLHKALDISSSLLAGIKGQSDFNFQMIEKDIRQIRHYLSMSWSGSKIVEKLAAGCPVPEAQAAFMLMGRFENSGGTEILQMIQLQCSACWVVQRNALRRKMELNSIRLLLPMTMDLLAILLIAMLPALLSLRII